MEEPIFYLCLAPGFYFEMQTVRMGIFVIIYKYLIVEIFNHIIIIDTGHVAAV